MSSDKSILFNGNNYSAWEFHLKVFIKGKDLWGHIDGNNLTPNKDKNKDWNIKWEVKDAQVMVLILGSIEHKLVLNLWPFKTAVEMWTYLKKLYNQHNTTRWFQFELELANLK